jgi:hypothetical protein
VLHWGQAIEAATHRALSDRGFANELSAPWSMYVLASTVTVKTLLVTSSSIEFVKCLMQLHRFTQNGITCASYYRRQMYVNENKIL